MCNDEFFLKHALHVGLQNVIDEKQSSMHHARQVNLQATKLFIVTSATKEGVTTPLDLALGSRYCIV